jgi:hypothetical protein
LVIFEIEIFRYRMHRAGGDACGAIDAYIGVDVDAIIVPVKTCDGTDGYAVGESARNAVVGHDMWHC